MNSTSSTTTVFSETKSGWFVNVNPPTLKFVKELSLMFLTSAFFKTTYGVGLKATIISTILEFIIPELPKIEFAGTFR